MSEVINGSNEVLKNVVEQGMLNEQALELNSDLVWTVKENMDIGRFQDAVAYSIISTVNTQVFGGVDNQLRVLVETDCN